MNKILMKYTVGIILSLVLLGVVGQEATFAYWFAFTFILWFSDKYYFFNMRQILMKPATDLRRVTAGPEGQMTVGRILDVINILIHFLAFCVWGWDVWTIVPMIAFYLTIELIIGRTRREFMEEALKGNLPPNFYVDF